MNAVSKSTLALVLLSATAYAAQPPDVVITDTVGNTAMGTNALLSLTGLGDNNTAVGGNALYSVLSGSENTAVGLGAIQGMTTGNYNTAVGLAALGANPTGSDNTAVGHYALWTGTNGSANTALGSSAMSANFGSYNTASGFSALQNSNGSYNTVSGVQAMTYSGGNYNTAMGANALYGEESPVFPYISVGSNNTAIGANALYSYITGDDNTATGFDALFANTTGNINTADGAQALQQNTTGWGNTATGQGALNHNTTGTVNIGLGYQAGENVTTGSHNIEIGNAGAAGDNNTIKIGTEGQQAKTFIAGIYNTSITGNAVMVNSSGQLGVVVSSERFKTAVAPMGAKTAKLGLLRPVIFKLRTDANGEVQYGLVAEEVAKVYPELVVRDALGRIDGVRYDELAPMLLNEMQKDHAKVAAQESEIRDLKRQLARMNVLEHDLTEMRAALTALRPKDQLVAQR